MNPFATHIPAVARVPPTYDRTCAGTRQRLVQHADVVSVRHGSACATIETNPEWHNRIHADQAPTSRSPAPTPDCIRA